MADVVYRQPAGSEGIAVISKADGAKLPRTALDCDDFILPSVPIFDAVSAADAEAPDSGTAQAGGTNTITLATTSSAVDGYYSANNCRIYITGGTGAGQQRMITGYVGSTRVATVDSSWATQPDSTSAYEIYMDCSDRSRMFFACSFSQPSQNGAFMKAKVRVKCYDDNRKMIFASVIEPMTLLKHTYALTGNYLSATAPFLDGTRALCEAIFLPIVRGARNYRIMLDGQPSQHNTYSAATNPNTVTYPSGDLRVYTGCV